VWNPFLKENQNESAELERGIHSFYRVLASIYTSIRLKIATDLMLTALRDKDNLLETVVHEMEAPVSAIRCISDVLSNSLMNIAKDLRSQINSIKDIDGLCSLILMMVKTISYAEAGKLPTTYGVKYYNLESDILNHSYNLIKPLILNRNFPIKTNTVKIYMRGTPKYIKCNKDYFLIVFFNLFSNAVKYSHKEKDIFHIDIFTDYVPDKGLYLYFEDMGIGIKTGEEQMIFEKRSRVFCFMN